MSRRNLVPIYVHPWLNRGFQVESRLEHFCKNCSHEKAQKGQKSFYLVTFAPLCGYGIN